MPSKQILNIRKVSTSKGVVNFNNIEDAKMDPEAVVNQLLDKADTQEQRAEIFREIPIRAHELGHTLNGVMAVTYRMAQEEEPWQYLGINQQEYLKQIRYEEVVKPAIEAYRRTDERCRKCLQGIETNWGTNWRVVVDRNNSLLPLNDSEHILGTIRRISYQIDVQHFGWYLTDAINHRLNNWKRGRRTGSLATLTDLSMVLATISKKAIGGNKRIIGDTSGDEYQSTNINVDTNSISIFKKQKLSTLVTRDNESEGGSQNPSTTQNEENDDNVSIGGEDQSYTKNTPIAGFGFHTCRCKDKPSAKAKLIQAKKHSLKDISLVIRDLKYLKPNVVNNLCWHHLRDFCSAVGLNTQTGGGRKELIRRLDYVRQNRYNLGKLKTQKPYTDWFKKAFKGTLPEDALGIMRFPSIPTASPFPVYNFQKVFERFAGSHVMKEWEEKGTITVRDAMGWLVNDREIFALITSEVNMYTHHRRMLGGKGNLGWLRSAYFSQIQ